MGRYLVLSCKRDLNAGSQGKGHRVVGDSHNLGVVRHSKYVTIPMLAQGWRLNNGKWIKFELNVLTYFQGWIVLEDGWRGV